jgi:hypothetical protein
MGITQFKFSVRAVVIEALDMKYMSHFHSLACRKLAIGYMGSMTEIIPIINRRGAKTFLPPSLNHR